MLAERARRPRVHRRRPGDVPRRVQQREIRPHLLGDEEKTRRARKRRVLTPRRAETIAVRPFAPSNTPSLVMNAARPSTPDARAAVERRLGERAVRGGDDERELDARRDCGVCDDARVSHVLWPPSEVGAVRRETRPGRVLMRTTEVDPSAP